MVADAKPENYVTAVKVGDTTTTDEVTVEVEAKTEATHFGSELISASLAESKVTITAAPATRWGSGEVAIPADVVKVINGEMFNSVGVLIGTIDDGNIVRGGGRASESSSAGSNLGMFKDNTNLTTYVGNLGKLEDGCYMFRGCTSLTTFVGDLGSLIYGGYMFADCQLSEESLMYIVDSLPENPNNGVQTTPYEPDDDEISYCITVGVADGVDKTPYVEEALAKGWTLK